MSIKAMSMPKSTFTENQIAKSINQTKDFAYQMLAKSKDENAKFPESKVICQCCFGSGFRSIYQNGKRFARKCETATWDEEKKKLICLGNPDSEKLELTNKKDLANQIWKIVVSIKQKEFFLFWLQREYKTQTLSHLLVQQLELVLNKVKAQNIFVVNQESKSQQAA